MLLRCICCMSQEGLGLREEQQIAVMSVRQDVLAWLDKAAQLRSKAFRKIGELMLWTSSVSDMIPLGHCSTEWAPAMITITHVHEHTVLPLLLLLHCRRRTTFDSLF